MSGVMERSVVMLSKALDEAEAINRDLLASLKAFVALYDGTRDMLGASVLAKLAAAEAAIAKAEEL